MKTAWTWTIFGLSLLALSLVTFGIMGSDGKALNPGVIALAALAGGGLLLLLWFVPKLQVRRLGEANAREHFNSENEARKSLAQIFGGIAFLATFYVSWANYNIEADKEVTETFGNAVEQLSKSDLSVRIGGAYILERLSKSSPKDYDAIISILTHAVQDHGQKGGSEKPGLAAAVPQERIPEASGDVETIIRILGRRQKPSTSTEDALNLEGSDLSGVRGRNLNLQWAYLVHTRMQGIYLYGVHFENAQLVGVDASILRIPKPGANPVPGQVDHCLDPEFFTHTIVAGTFSCGHFNKAVLVDGDFEGASFNDADLTRAKLNQGNFRRAHFSNANLAHADLNGADFSGADLSTVVGITKEQWNSTKTDACTRAPKFDTDASQWKATSCEGQ
jgi:hypothetical protein